MSSQQPDSKIVKWDTPVRQGIILPGVSARTRSCCSVKSSSQTSTPPFRTASRVQDESGARYEVVVFAFAKL